MSGCCQFTESFTITKTISNLRNHKVTKRTQVYEIIMEVTSNDDQSVAGCSIDGSEALITPVLLDLFSFLSLLGNRPFYSCVLSYLAFQRK